LIAAWRRTRISDAAIRVITDDSREFFTSQLVKLETLPKARHEKNRSEPEFYETHFACVVHCQCLSEALGEAAESLASQYGLAGPDALQIAAAIRQGVTEFFTSEKPGKPMFRLKEIKVISLYSLA
jgi:predicted nucleic acid-binding protein